MSGANSTYEVRLRAVRAVLEENVPITTVAGAYGAERSTIHRWVVRYQEAEDEAGLLRRAVSGRPKKLDEVDADALYVPLGGSVCSVDRTSRSPGTPFYAQ